MVYSLGQIQQQFKCSILLLLWIVKCQSFSVGNEDHKDISPQYQISVSVEVKENQVEADLVSEIVIGGDSNGY